ncbi:MAG: hypothetical protein ABRQ39_06030 [Candidatus Eremiobacterota bacterium]
MSLTTIPEINQFLNEFKEIVTSNDWLEIIRRENNISGMIGLGLDQDLATEEILYLTYKDYSEGPKDDRGEGYHGEIWVFGKVINNKLAYIKLKIDIKAGEKIAKCLSFHPAYPTMNLPYSDGNI